ncbi:uncharacterized protein [Aegilops tauschii subsp. strangulata]|uniref:uncharacterized protein n=1 Tax=Aegilops tauschii subsp. strangulata TaxID=200361 RepID=UPI00098A996D
MSPLAAPALNHPAPGPSHLPHSVTFSIQIAPSSFGGPVLPLEVTWPQSRQVRLPGLEPLEVAGDAHRSRSIRRRANMNQSLGDCQRQHGAEHGRALHAGRRHQQHQFHQMVLNCSSLGNWCKIYTKTISSLGLEPIDTLRTSASCRCKVWQLVRVTWVCIASWRTGGDGD